MAPIAIETQRIEPVAVDPAKVAAFRPNPSGYKEQQGGAQEFDAKSELLGNGDQAPAKYPHYLPTWDRTKTYPPLEPFEHVDRGKFANPSFPDIIGKASKVGDLTPSIGTEIHGVQLSQLSDAGKDQLALLVAQRKLVIFRQQDFADLPISKALEIGGYFGRHHIHPASGAPEGHPEVHLVHRSAGDKQGKNLLTERVSSIAWHSDVTYELQPPGTTFLYILETPRAGGDTLFVDQGEAYRRLSPAFRERLHGLSAIHSGFEQAQGALGRGSHVRREPVSHIHPIVRTHPVTGEKALFVNEQFTRQIVGLRKEESDYLLKFLFDHISKGADFQARVKWETGSVVLWDNRVTGHSAILDWFSGARRHLARITPQAERPFETPYNAEEEERIELERLG